MTRPKPPSSGILGHSAERRRKAQDLAISGAPESRGNGRGLGTENGIPLGQYQNAENRPVAEEIRNIVRTSAPAPRRISYLLVSADAATLIRRQLRSRDPLLQAAAAEVD